MPTAAQEKLWDYDAVQPGQDGSPTVVQLSAEHIAAYAQVAQNPDPRFHVSATNAEYGGKLAAMPTMILTYAPLMRPEIAEHQGFVALEDSTTARRQTPFAKCEVCWFKPVLAGDTLTVNYCGVGMQSRQMFDSSWTRGEPISFPLDGLIQGWIQGLPGMKVGGQRLLVIPGDLGYGPQGQGTILPNETLVFVVELVSIP